jgi:hypothetical protein
MKRTQVQIPDPLYREVKRVARLRDWSVSEVFRRAAEQLVAQYPDDKHPGDWALPEPREMGVPLVPPEEWRDVIADDEARSI